MKYKIHPYCELFPTPDTEQREAMRESIKTHRGLVDSVWSWCGKIVEGKTRLEICEEEDIDPGAFREWRPSSNAHTQEQMDDELWQFIKAKNIDRRHMTATQIAAVLLSYQSLRAGPGRPSQKTATKSPVTLQHIANEGHVSLGTVKLAANVQRNGDPKVFEAVKQGIASGHDAESVVDKPREAQRRAVDAVKSGKSKTLKEAVDAQVKPAIPEKLQPIFALVDQFKAFDKVFCPKTQDLASDAARVLFSGSTKYEQDAKLVANLMGKIHAIIMPWMPDRVCDCKAENKGCKCCKGRGWLPKSGRQS